MDLSALPSPLATLAGSAVGAFVVAVILDDALGVLSAIKSRTFDLKALPSFLESQFGTKAALAVLGILAGAYFAGPSNPDLKNALLAALTAGASAQTVALLKDIKDKVGYLISKAPAAPVIAPPAA